MEIDAVMKEYLNDCSVVSHVPFVDLKRQYLQYKYEILEVVDRVFSSGNYILGEFLDEFELRVADYLGCKYVLGVANGTDALVLAMKSLGIGENDEIILPVNSFIASAGAVVAVGARPVLCDVGEDYNIDASKVESLVNPRTRAIMPVHLTGRPADMSAITSLAEKYSLYVIEDAAQSLGARYENIMTGTMGHIGCFSLHPLKNLHVYGDGGLVCTNDRSLYDSVRILRNHGLVDRNTCQNWGLNSRLDAVQAAIAGVGLNYLDVWNTKRRQTAKQYCASLKNKLEVPEDRAKEYAIYHNFFVQCDRRDALMQFLQSRGIETRIHYPIQIHMQPAAMSLGYKLGDFPVAEKQAERILSLPVYSEITAMEVRYVIEGIMAFSEEKSYA